MARKSTKAKKAAVVAEEAKSDETSPATPARRSGRGSAKSETPPSTPKSRSRRSSTAAQTAASAAESKPKASSEPQGESPPPATRVKTSRRSSSRINYKESDGEEDAPVTKYDANFDSDEFEESDSESEKTKKSRGRGRAPKSSGRKSSAKERGGRKGAGKGRRGRPKKKAIEDEDEEDSETFDVSDDSVEREEKPKPEVKSKRGRKPKSATPTEPKVKSRRSARTSEKDEEEEVEVKKRPSRSVKAKKYTEEEEDEDAEEVEAKEEEEEEEEEVDSSSRKRKREGSEETSHKRLKEEEEKGDEEAKKTEGGKEDSAEEPMECEKSDAASNKDDVKEKDTVKEGIAEEKPKESAFDKQKVAADDVKEKSDDLMDTEPSTDAEKEPGSSADPIEDKPDGKEDSPMQISAAAEASNDATQEEQPVADSHDSAANSVSEEAEFPTDTTTCPRENSVPEEPADATPNAANEVQGQNSEPSLNSSATVPDDSVRANGEHVEEGSAGRFAIPGRRYISNPKVAKPPLVGASQISVLSFNLASYGSDSSLTKEKFLHEINMLDAGVVCFQQVQKPFYTGVLEPSLDGFGFRSVFCQPPDSLKGMATFYKSPALRLAGSSEVSLRQLIEKELELSPLEHGDKASVQSQFKKCGNALFTHLEDECAKQQYTVINVQIPKTNISVHALQISCLGREIGRINDDSGKRIILAGEFNAAESEPSYQLLRDGYLSNEMIEDLQRQADVALPGKENASLVNLLWKSFQHPSSHLCSCYQAVLDHELRVPELKTTSPDLLWFSSNKLHVSEVLDIGGDCSGDGLHFYLKADFIPTA